MAKKDIALNVEAIEKLLEQRSQARARRKLEKEEQGMPVRGFGRLVSVVLVSTLALWLLVGCGGGQKEGAQEGGAPEEGAEPVTGEFVGKASGQDAHVAIVAMEGDAAGESEVIGYICNGPGGLDEWFWGLASENTVDLESEDGGAHLQATLNEEGAEGTIELADGESVSFVTARTGDGPEGLYQLTLSPDGEVLGTSWSDKRLESEIPPEGTGPVTGEVILPDGSSIPLEYSPGAGVRINDAGELRAIILPDGSRRGSKTKRTGGTNTGYTCPYMMD